MTTDTIVRFVGIEKTYDGVTRVVDDLDLDVARGEFLTLLGPVGVGQDDDADDARRASRAPTAGEILLDGKPHRHMPPHKRDIGMVFQNYALFPHMTVGRERRLSAAGARHRARPRSQRESSARSTWCSSAAFGGRRPAQLSGGQQQRIALARALVFEPKLILMDEPLGALDKQLREQMQLEIRACTSASA